jgi:hypothetical protein
MISDLSVHGSLVIAENRIAPTQLTDSAVVFGSNITQNEAEHGVRIINNQIWAYDGAGDKSALRIGDGDGGLDGPFQVVGNHFRGTDGTDTGLSAILANDDVAKGVAVVGNYAQGFTGTTYDLGSVTTVADAANLDNGSTVTI